MRILLEETAAAVAASAEKACQMEVTPQPSVTPPSTSAPPAKATLPTIRYQYYQTVSAVHISVMAKGLSSEDVRVVFLPDHLKIAVSQGGTEGLCPVRVISHDGLTVCMYVCMSARLSLCVCLSVSWCGVQWLCSTGSCSRRSSPTRAAWQSRRPRHVLQALLPAVILFIHAAAASTPSQCMCVCTWSLCAQVDIVLKKKSIGTEWPRLEGAAKRPPPPAATPSSQPAKVPTLPP